ncbi:MAG: hypothetical protein ABFC71_06500 [Methanoregula sp.]
MKIVIQKVRIGRFSRSGHVAKRFPGVIAIAPNFFPARSGTGQKYFWADLHRDKKIPDPIVDEAKKVLARSDLIFRCLFRQELFILGKWPNDFFGPIGYAPYFFLARFALRRKFFWRVGRCGKNIFRTYEPGPGKFFYWG